MPRPEHAIEHAALPQLVTSKRLREAVSIGRSEIARFRGECLHSLAMVRRLSERSCDPRLRNNAAEEYRRQFRRVLEAFGGLAALRTRLYELAGIKVLGSAPVSVAVQKAPVGGVLRRPEGNRKAIPDLSTQSKPNTVVDYAEAVYTFEAVLYHSARESQRYFLDVPDDVDQRQMDEVANRLAQHHVAQRDDDIAAKVVLAEALFMWRAARVSFSLRDSLEQSTALLASGDDPAIAAAKLACEICTSLQQGRPLPAWQIPRGGHQVAKSLKFVLVTIGEAVRPISVEAFPGSGANPAHLKGVLEHSDRNGVVARLEERDGDRPTIIIKGYRRDQTLWTKHRRCVGILFGIVVGVDVWSGNSSSHYRATGTGARCPDCGKPLPKSLEPVSDPSLAQDDDDSANEEVPVVS